MKTKNRMLIADVVVDKAIEEAFTYVITPEKTLYPCTGCFDCWLKTPGQCKIRDNIQCMGEYLARCEEVVVLSDSCYGGLSAFAKNVFDRSISYVQPDFVIKHKEMHHKQRYVKDLTMKLYLYGSIHEDEEEQAIAKRWVEAMADNFYVTSFALTFLTSFKEWEDLYENRIVEWKS